MKNFSVIIAFVLALLIGAPAFAVSPQSNTKFRYLHVTKDLLVDGNAVITGTTTQTGNYAVTGNLAVTGTTLLTGVATLSAQPVVTPATMSIGGNVMTFPGSAQTIVGRTTTDTLTNKTLTLPIISSISNGGTVTIPSGADTLMTLGAAQAVTGVKTSAAGAALSTMGTGTATYSPGGRLSSLSAIKTSATGSAQDAVYTLPANTLVTTGQGLRIRIHGTTAVNGNTKACNFIFGAVTITLPLSTGSAKDFYADILVYRTGSSAQQISVAGYANNALIAGLSTTATATETSTITMTANVPISTGNGDVVLDEYTITAEQ